MRPRALLVTFDAWNTLFKPREPIAKQYAKIAREHGLLDITDRDIGKGFKRAFRAYCQKYPNYGKSVGMNPEEWWGRVVASTFFPRELQPSLVSAVISHFSTAEPYSLHPSVPVLLDELRSKDVYDSTVIGVISNSDSRVASVLKQLGIAIRSYPPLNLEDTRNGKNGMIDFLTLSYDVGVEKPHHLMFETAFEEARRLTIGKDMDWERVHVGDDLSKDVSAAEGAGWRGVLWEDKSGPEDILKKILGY